MMVVPFFLISTASAASDILFVGNSYTFYNNLDALVAEVFEASGDAVDTRRLTAGGLRLANHASRASDESSEWHTLLVTETEARDWVVLQDQSQIPGFPITSADWISSRDAAIVLDDLVESAGAHTMFFLTWGYVEGDPGNEWLYPDYAAMQARLQEGYRTYAEACASEDRPVWIAPVGPAFAHIRRQLMEAGEDPLASGSLFRSLYSGDGSHPSRLGSQLAAYVFFASLTGESPVGLTAPDSLDSATVLLLQEAAASVVFDTTDTFSFPWEGTDATDEETGSEERDSGTIASDSGTASSEEDSGTVSSGEEDPPSGTDTAPPASVDTGSGASSSPSDTTDSASENESESGTSGRIGDASTDEGSDSDVPAKRGCATVESGSRVPMGFSLLVFMGLAHRQRRFR